MSPSPEFNRSARAVTSIPLPMMAHADQDMKTSPKIQYTVNHTPKIDNQLINFIPPCYSNAFDIKPPPFIWVECSNWFYWSGNQK